MGNDPVRGWQPHVTHPGHMFRRSATSPTTATTRRRATLNWLDLVVPSIASPLHSFAEWYVNRTTEISRGRRTTDLTERINDTPLQMCELTVGTACTRPARNAVHTTPGRFLPRTTCPDESGELHARRITRTGDHVADHVATRLCAARGPTIVIQVIPRSPPRRNVCGGR